MVAKQEGHEVRLLIVDDEPMMVQLLSLGLQKLGPHLLIDTATSGQVALNLVNQSEYDVALLDYRMPGMDGLTLARLIRESSPHTQLVLMTAYGPQAIAKAREVMPMDGYFTKPVSMQTLRDMLEGLLTQQEFSPAYVT